MASRDEIAAPPPTDAADAWRRGAHLEGVHFGPGDRVLLLEGDDAGHAGRIVSLQALAPEPLYVVALDADGRDVGALQSGLAPGGA